MQHLHTEYERELVPLFVKVLGIYASGSKETEDTVERVQIVPVKLNFQPDKQRDLLFVERSAVKIVSIRNPHAAAVASGSLNGVRTHEYRNIPANRSPGNLELKGQIVVCIMPPSAQHFQQFLPPFAWTAHVFTPLRCSWGEAKKLMGRVLAHSSKFTRGKMKT